MIAENNLKADAVFEGGGVKGIGLVGAVAVAEEQGYHWQNVAGTSAGAIVAALVAAGYTGAELKEIMKELDYNHFKDTGFWDRIPFLGPLTSILFEKGIYEGDFLIKWIGDLLKAKGVTTFGDLASEEYGNEEQYRFKLKVIASDITRGRILILPDDIVEYGIRPDLLNVASAVRMSMSIPFFFEPVTLKNASSGKKSYIVDGGLLSNFPVWLFDSEGGIPPWPTFGFKLVEPEAGLPNLVKGPFSLLTALFKTMMEAHDARYIKDKDFVRTIAIPTLGVQTTEFDITSEKSENLYQSGRKAAEEFFQGWNFSDYIEKYRKDKTEIPRKTRLNS